MAVGIDTSSESHTGTTGSTSEASFEWNHVQNGNKCQSVLVYTFTNANADDATAVNYGGVALSAISGGRAVDTAGEAGDCKTWFADLPLSLPSAPPNVSILGVIFAGGFWLRFGASGTLQYARRLDGTWSNPSANNFPNTQGIYEIASDEAGMWVAVGGGGNIYYSTDPTGTWSAASSPGFGTSDIYSVHWGNGNWVAAGADGKTRYATDPTGTWSAATTGSNAVGIGGLEFDGTYWLISNNDGQMFYATDPAGTWSAVSSPGFGTNDINCVRVGKDVNGAKILVACASNGNIRYASDPTGTWSAAASPGFGGTTELSHVDYFEGLWVCSGQSENVGIRYATDPTGTWSAANLTWNSLIQSLGGGPDGWAACSFSTPDNFRVASDPKKEWLGNTNIVHVDRTNNADSVYAVAITLTGNSGLAVHTAGIQTDSTDGTCAEKSVTDGGRAVNSMRFAGINSGLSGIVDNPGTPGTNNLSRGTNSTVLQSIDYGTRVTMVVRETTAGTGARSVGFSATTSDDRAAVYLAIYERFSQPPFSPAPSFKKPARRYV